ncbi:hypothetical protein [Paraburkholderia unamae]|jgi:hypothetical protein|uniref:hypothetical protein n=1 Tax=Paraburkholderia unamae TaxID=219649 RepID=UPI0011BF3D73|nr:hypothetical protein [Paraburkholderia unamae]
MNHHETRQNRTGLQYFVSRARADTVGYKTSRGMRYKPSIPCTRSPNMLAEGFAARRRAPLAAVRQ